MGGEIALIGDFFVIGSTGLKYENKYLVLATGRCTIKIFRGEGVVDGEGGSSEGCLNWGGGGWGSLRDLSKNILKQGVGKGESCS